jgi:hypothetical protein
VDYLFPLSFHQDKNLATVNNKIMLTLATQQFRSIFICHPTAVKRYGHLLALVRKRCPHCTVWMSFEIRAVAGRQFSDPSSGPSGLRPNIPAVVGTIKPALDAPHVRAATGHGW